MFRRLRLGAGIIQRNPLAFPTINTTPPLGMTRLYSSKLDDAAKKLKTLSIEPDNDVKLELYALFKQATIGVVSTPKPGAFDFVGQAKWNAWKKLKSMSKSSAADEYSKLVNKLAAEEEASAGRQETMSSTSDDLLITKDRGVLTVTLNRPTKKNSLSFAMYRDLIDLVNNAAKDDSVNFFVLTSTGDFFSSGNDLSNFTESLKKGTDIKIMAHDASELVREYIAAFIDFPKPMLALVPGPSIGVSCTVLGLFDIVYASDIATFQTPFSQLGLSPEGCSSYTFPRAMGHALASEVLLLNKVLTAQEAKSCGFITDVFPAADFQAECAKRVDAISKQPAKSLMFSKILNRAPIKEQLHKVNIDECLRLEERFLSKEAMGAVMNFFKSKGKSNL